MIKHLSGSMHFSEKYLQVFYTKLTRKRAHERQCSKKAYFSHTVEPQRLWIQKVLQKQYAKWQNCIEHSGKFFKSNSKLH